jgi:hypothetical protein
MASQIFVDAGIDPLGSLDGSIRQAKNGRHAGTLLLFPARRPGDLSLDFKEWTAGSIGSGRYGSGALGALTETLCRSWPERVRIAGAAGQEPIAYGIDGINDQLANGATRRADALSMPPAQGADRNIKLGSQLHRRDEAGQNAVRHSPVIIGGALSGVGRSLIERWRPLVSVTQVFSLDDHVRALSVTDSVDRRRTETSTSSPGSNRRREGTEANSVLTRE